MNECVAVALFVMAKLISVGVDNQFILWSMGVWISNVKKGAIINVMKCVLLVEWNNCLWNCLNS